ncbi:MAG: S41 family peptidase [Bacteroidota bacterium]
MTLRVALLACAAACGCWTTFSQPAASWADPHLLRGTDDVPASFSRQFAIPLSRPDVAKKPGHFTAADWRHAIDSVWGPGLPTAEKLRIFDRIWRVIDSSFACFHNLPLNWDSLGVLYRSEVAQGVSRGRFAAIMMHLSLALRESHTIASDAPVCYLTPLDAGVPLLVMGPWGDNGHFGAGLTPLPDSSLLVYTAVPSHPLGLTPGDIVLGYDRRPWKRLYEELLAAQLPLCSGWWWGSSPSAYTHSFLMGAGMNWHLFDTIDVVKYAGGDTLHLSTAPLRGAAMSVFCSEQMDIPRVPKPDSAAQVLVTSGIIAGTNIGYIYAWGWFWNAQSEFLNAVQSLMQTDGLIIDFRMNYGGNMILSNPGLNLLFPAPTPTIDFAVRCHPDFHELMCPINNSWFYVIPGSPPGYTKPIAVLTGPGALSSGDQVALRMKFHPHARFFGKSTSAAFNGPRGVDVNDPDWYFRYAAADAFLLSSPGSYLTHEELPVDQIVWHTQSAVAQGRDNVVEVARAWIDSSLTAVEEQQAQAPLAFRLRQNYPNPCNMSTRIPFSIPVSGYTSLRVYDGLGREVARVLDGELEAGDHDLPLDASRLASGVYHYRLRQGGSAATRPFVLLK